MPVSVRTDEQKGTFGNRVSMMVAPIPTDVADTRERLMRAHEVLKVAKERHKAVPATILQDATQFIPPAVHARASRAVLGLQGMRPPLNVIISNVPGPRDPLYCAGAQLQANFPVSVITHGVGPQHHRDELPRPPRLGDRDRPRAGRRRVADLRGPAPGARRDRPGDLRDDAGGRGIGPKPGSADAGAVTRTAGLGAVIAVAVAAALAGCGGGSGPSKAAFVKKADALCLQTNVVHPRKPQPKNAKDAAAQASEEITIRTGLDTKLRALDVPKDSKKDFDAYNAQTTVILGWIAREKADAQANAEKKYTQDVASFSKATAAREAIAKRLGFKVCSRTIPVPPKK